MKNIIVSGSSSGIGAAISEQLLDAGHQVIGLARDHSKFKKSSQNYLPQQMDFSAIAQLTPQLKILAKQYSDVNALIISAGYGQFAEFEQWSVNDIQRMMDVNFISQTILIKTWLPLMKKAGQGRIVVIGSECALQGEKKASIYAASKFALRGFCQSIRKESANKGVGVTLINPGITRTPFFDKLDFQPGEELQHAIEAQQVADTVMSVLSLPDNCVAEEINLQPLRKVVVKKHG